MINDFMPVTVNVDLPRETMEGLIRISAARKLPDESPVTDAAIQELIVTIVSKYVRELSPKTGVVYQDVRDDQSAVAAFTYAVLRSALEQGMRRLVLPREPGFDAGELVNGVPISQDKIAMKRLEAMMTITTGHIPIRFYDQDFTVYVQFVDLPNGQRRAELLIEPRADI